MGDHTQPRPHTGLWARVAFGYCALRFVSHCVYKTPVCVFFWWEGEEGVYSWGETREQIAQVADV